MKVLMLCDFFDESLNYQENVLSKYYVKYGHEVIVVTSTFTSVFDFINDRYDVKSVASDYVANGVRIIRLPYRLNWLNRVRRFAPLHALLEAEQPDLVFAHDIMLNMTDAIPYLRRNTQARMIMDYHADYSNSGKNWLSLKVLHGIIRKRVLDRARPHLQRIFPIVPASAQFLREVYRVPDHEMELLPLGADLDLSRQVEDSMAGAVLRQRYGIASDALVIFTGGKLAPAKRTELLVQAFATMPDPSLRLVVAGDAAPNDQAYKRQLEERVSADPRVILTGWLDAHDLLAHLDMADLAVFPASQSILWQQAIGMGLPLVIGEPMAWPGGRQDVSYLNRYGNITLVERDADPIDGLATQLRQLLSDAGLRQRMAEGARRVANELLDWNDAVMRTLAFNTSAVRQSMHHSAVLPMPLHDHEIKPHPLQHTPK